MYDQHTYKIGQVYLNSKFKLKQIVGVDVSVGNTPIYKYYLFDESQTYFGWDSDRQIWEGILRLDDYLNGK